MRVDNFILEPRRDACCRANETKLTLPYQGESETVPELTYRNDEIIVATEPYSRLETGLGRAKAHYSPNNTTIVEGNPLNLDAVTPNSAIVPQLTLPPPAISPPPISTPPALPPTEDPALTKVKATIAQGIYILETAEPLHGGKKTVLDYQYQHSSPANSQAYINQIAPLFVNRPDVLDALITPRRRARDSFKLAGLELKRVENSKFCIVLSNANEPAKVNETPQDAFATPEDFTLFMPTRVLQQNLGTAIHETMHVLVGPSTTNPEQFLPNMTAEQQAEFKTIRESFKNEFNLYGKSHKNSLIKNNEDYIFYDTLKYAMTNNTEFLAATTQLFMRHIYTLECWPAGKKLVALYKAYWGIDPLKQQNNLLPATTTGVV
jgi:hypothetical protein